MWCCNNPNCRGQLSWWITTGSPSYTHSQIFLKHILPHKLCISLLLEVSIFMLSLMIPLLLYRCLSDFLLSYINHRYNTNISWFFIDWHTLNFTLSLFNLNLSSPLSMSTGSLLMAKNSHPTITGTSKSTSKSKITKSVGKMKFFTFTSTA